jgi:predicted peroxiredoxin
MSKRTFHVVVGVVAFLVGGLSVWWVTQAEEGKASSKLTSMQAPASKAAIGSVVNAQKQPILVNITRGKDELHAVSMAIGLAQAARRDGRTAVIFLNVEAPVFATKDLSPEVKYADFPPIRKMLADFTAAGGQVLVCGHCAHVVQLKQEDMIDGAKLLGDGEVFAAMPPGTAVFSY